MSEKSFKLAFGVQITISKREQLVADISAVILGLKPSLLLDCGLTSGSKFRTLLVDILTSLQLNAKDVLKCLCILKIYDDLMLINVPALLSMKYMPRYVNIDKGVLSPCVLEVNTSQYVCIEEVISKVFGKLKIAASEVRIMQTEDCYLDSEIPIVELDSLVGEFNLCTLFGRLLGYPVVYWFEVNNGYTLGMVPLIRYLVKVTKNDKSITSFEAAQPCTGLFLKERVVYSFTVPTVLLPEVEATITNWIETLSSVTSENKLELTVSTDTVCLPHIAL